MSLYSSKKQMLKAGQNYSLVLHTYNICGVQNKIQSKMFQKDIYNGFGI